MIIYQREYFVKVTIVIRTELLEYHYSYYLLNKRFDNCFCHPVLTFNLTHLIFLSTFEEISKNLDKQYIVYLISPCRRC